MKYRAYQWPDQSPNDKKNYSFWRFFV